MSNTLSGLRVTIEGLELLNCVAVALLVGTKFEAINNVVHAIDGFLCRRVRWEVRAVLATLTERSPG